MTVLDAQPEVAAVEPGGARAAAGSARPTLADLPALVRRPGTLETLLVLPAVLWWALPLTHATGGRDPLGLAVELVLLLVAVAATRPWRRLHPVTCLLGASIGLAAAGVCALAPTGWSGGDDAAAYAAAGLALPAAAAWARTPARRLAAALAIVLGGLDQFVHALLPWWGGRDPSVRLSGTFYWYNPFAAYLLPAALLGLALIVWRLRPAQAAGWVAAPLCVAGVVLSTSRATLAVLAVGWVAIGVLAVVSADGRARRAARWAAASLVTVATTYVLPGQPLFDHRVSPFGSTVARSTAGGQTLASNGGYRVEFWRESLQSFTHNPLWGSGFHGLISASRPYVPTAWAESNYAHDGYLQALSDGGLLLGLPFLAACGVLGVLALRRCWAALRGTSEPAVVVAALALLAGMAHSAVDFDWSHSSVLIQAALLGGIVVAGGRATAGAGTPGPTLRQMPAVAVAVLLTLTALAGVAVTSALHRTKGDVEAVQPLPLDRQATALARAAEAWLATDLAGRRLLDLAINHPADATDAQRRAALDNTARAAEIDESLAVERAVVQLQLGDRKAATATADRMLPDALRILTLANGERDLLDRLGRAADAATLPTPPAEPTP